MPDSSTTTVEGELGVDLYDQIRAARRDTGLFDALMDDAQHTDVGGPELVLRLQILVSWTDGNSDRFGAPPPLPAAVVNPAALSRAMPILIDLARRADVPRQIMADEAVDQETRFAAQDAWNAATDTLGDHAVPVITAAIEVPPPSETAIRLADEIRSLDASRDNASAKRAFDVLQETIDPVDPRIRLVASWWVQCLSVPSFAAVMPGPVPVQDRLALLRQIDDLSRPGDDVARVAAILGAVGRGTGADDRQRPEREVAP